MQTLIERIEAAQGPDRELDREIADAMGWETLSTYTASLDAALTLVPEGWDWAYLDGRAIVRKPKVLAHGFGEAATPALALVAAALKARNTDNA